MSAAFWDEVFADVVLSQPDPSGAACIARELGLVAGDRVLDQGCGTGRMSVAMAERGLVVIAVDAVPAYVDRLRARAPEVEAHVGDAAGFRPSSPVDGVFSWATSLGFGARAADDRRVLAAARSSLRPGGRYLVDVGNAQRIKRQFQAELVQHLDGPAGAVRVRRSSVLEGDVLHQEWTYELPDGRVHRASAPVRLYEPGVLTAALRDVGFGSVRLLGSAAGEGWQPDSPRCIAVAR